MREVPPIIWIVLFFIGVSTCNYVNTKSAAVKAEAAIACEKAGGKYLVGKCRFSSENQ